MSELSPQIDRYLANLARRGNSVHTVDAYGARLREFLHYLSLPPIDDVTRNALHRDKRARHTEICRRAQQTMAERMAADV